MAIDKTVEMCRQSAKTDLVRSVLAATKFNDPEEVIAKLITEQATSETERQILAYQKYRGNKNQNHRGNKRFQFNSQRNDNNRNNGYNYIILLLYSILYSFQPFFQVKYK